jgi:hypothetical protein
VKEPTPQPKRHKPYRRAALKSETHHLVVEAEELDEEGTGPLTPGQLFTVTAEEREQARKN